MKLPNYKSFNKVINDALDYGLPLLLKAEFGEVADESFEPQHQPTVKPIDCATEEYFMRVVKLLQEVIINATVNKSILCSLFQAKSLELNGNAVSGKKFEQGSFRDTPDYLAKYELQALRNLSK